jgi:hypothetical protein
LSSVFSIYTVFAGGTGLTLRALFAFRTLGTVFTVGAVFAGSARLTLSALGAVFTVGAGLPLSASRTFRADQRGAVVAPFT